jgi:putative flippase GtrA
MKGTARQLARSVLVSQLAFWLDFGLLALLTEVAGIYYLGSAAISFLAGTSLSYVLSVRWVFEVRRFPSKLLEYGTFVLVGVVGLALNEGLLWVFTAHLRLYYLVAKIIAGALVFFWNFGARKWLLFR